MQVLNLTRLPCASKIRYFPDRLLRRSGRYGPILRPPEGHRCRLMESKMTFEEFQATRRWSNDLTEGVRSKNWETEGNPKGYLYLDGLFIDHVEPHWPEASRKKGEWHLLLNRDEWISNDLAALERRLYDWAVSERYFED
jgi:hypothetical protein